MDRFFDMSYADKKQIHETTFTSWTNMIKLEHKEKDMNVTMSDFSSTFYFFFSFCQFFVIVLITFLSFLGVFFIVFYFMSFYYLS